ncbi:MAG: sugar phosphate nucleotidyltransferase [Leptospirales bacterium]|jgi:mannose-1-phosphate guanylyltransferase
MAQKKKSKTKSKKKTAKQARKSKKDSGKSKSDKQQKSANADQSAQKRKSAKKLKKSSGPVVLIMAGGKGERFWPRSRISHPKQLQKVYSSRTLLEETIVRARTVTDDSRIFIGCNAELKKAILKTHKGVKASQFVVEPEGRNTAPIIALAALQFEKQFPGAVHVVLSADHFITPLDAFETTLRKAMDTARAGWLVTLGVRPNRPETGYGYIAAGEMLPEGPGAHAIESFVEKPDEQRARDYLGRGNYYWNSGIFIWSGPRIVEEFRKHAPEVIGPLEADGVFSSAKKLARIFPGIPDHPVDVAIMEKSERIAMIPAEFAWDDVGSWLSLRRIAEPDSNGNLTISTGKAASIAAMDSRDNLVVTDKKLVALLGVENVVLVEEQDLLFLARADKIDQIKEFIGTFKSNPTLQKFLK